MLVTAGVAKQTRGKDDHHIPYDLAFGVGSAYVVLKTSVHACENSAEFYASQRLASNNDVGRAYAERGE